MNHLTVKLLKRLNGKGLSPIAIPRFVRDVADAMTIDYHHVDLEGMNRRLDLLGWGPEKMDYQTLQLIMASLEDGNLTDAVNRLIGRFEKSYHPDPQGLKG